MRPARKGPENPTIARTADLTATAASMRPARKGPENLCRPAARGWRSRCFNEAGPQGAGKPSVSTYIAGSGDVCFNEAGPQGAGKPDVAGSNLDTPPLRLQ